MAREEHDDGHDSSRPSHISPISVIVETSLNGANDPKGPRCRKPGPTLPSVVAATPIVSRTLSAGAGIAESIAMSDAPTAQKPT